MQICYNCGKEVDDNVLICPECGALVRRYTKPAQQIPEPENVPPRSAAYPGAYETPAQESRRERVWLDAAGKPHLNGALCFWLIVCAVFTAYLVFAFGCVLLVYHAQSYFIETLESFPEFSDMLKLLDVMLESVETYYAFYVAVPVLFAGKLCALQASSSAAVCGRFYTRSICSSRSSSCAKTGRSSGHKPSQRNSRAPSVGGAAHEPECFTADIC